MSDRKYRQRGYQDSPREPRRESKPQEKREYTPRGQPPVAPKTFNMPGFREVVRCKTCGNELTVAGAWSPEGTCARCGAALHSCAQCVNFDTSAAFECQKPIPARISPKDALNSCTFFEPRTTVERETKTSSSPSSSSGSSSGSSSSPSARKAFDDLFK
jgi:ribosomal protein S27E